MKIGYDEIPFTEALLALKDDMEVTLECEGYTYEIGPAEGFLGGENIDGYISVVLGNVVYDSAERILKESINYLSDSGTKEVLIYI